MILYDAIQQIDKSESNKKWIDHEKLFDTFGLNSWDADDDKVNAAVEAYYLYSWICTDTEVGLAVYFLNGEPMGIGVQNARKNPENFRFFTEDKYNRMATFLLECMNSRPHSKCDLINLDAEMDDYFTLEFAAAIRFQHGFYQGQRVRVTDFMRDQKGEWMEAENGFDEKFVQYLKVVTPTGEELTIPTDEFKIPVYLSYNKDFREWVK